MILGFYYHIPVYVDTSGKIWLPSFLGVFLDSLAANSAELHLYLHEEKTVDSKMNDYSLKGENINFHSLGPKTAAWRRTLFPGKYLKPIRYFKGHYFIVRSPSPLAPYFPRFINKSTLRYLVVGDYAESILQGQKFTFRNWLIEKMLQWNNFLFVKQIKRYPLIVNSSALFEKYQPIQANIDQIRTTTLQEKDFFHRKDTCEDLPIKLLYTGRMDWQKGLKELLEAGVRLKKENRSIEIHFVGWEDDVKEPVKKTLFEMARSNELEKSVFFHGKKSVGEELNQYYRMADLYVLPSYHEGFPRTIWEAMANSLPVITTTVGSIPFYLVNEENALLIEPKNAEELYHAIVRMIDETEVRLRLIANGRELAKEMTLEIQTKKLIKILKKGND